MKKLMALIAMAIMFTGLAAAPASASDRLPAGCVAADNVYGWTEICFRDGEYVAIGTIQMNRALDVVILDIYNRSVCGQESLHGSGWQQWRCDSGRMVFGYDNWDMEALRLSVPGVGTLCMQAYVQDIGVQKWWCGLNGTPVTVGTIAQGLRLEGIAFFYTYTVK